MKTKLIIFLLIALDVILVFYLLISQANPAILAPAGPIASQEKGLLQFAFILAMIIILPVFALFVYVTRSYRDNGKKSYAPDWTPQRLLVLLWWILPAVIVLILGYRTWFATHDLDPHKPLETGVQPITIQVVALRWKWLFIYPEQQIATVNFVQFPEDTPVNFELTADAPMNSLWIPRLGGQVYAMSGMSTKLHLLAEKAGDYNGSAAEISGPGFSGMRFTARASSREEFETWVSSVKNSSRTLSLNEYNKLAKPTEHHPVTLYSETEKDLYGTIIMKYMAPQKSKTHTMKGMPHK
jgi:cytochrome o ubiquinol oxidase subunit II